MFFRAFSKENKANAKRFPCCTLCSSVALLFPFFFSGFVVRTRQRDDASRSGWAGAGPFSFSSTSTQRRQPGSRDQRDPTFLRSLSSFSLSLFFLFLLSAFFLFLVLIFFPTSV